MNNNGFHILQNASGIFYAYGGPFYGYSKTIAQNLVDEMNRTKAENDKMKEILKQIDVQSVDPDVLKLIMEL